MTAEPVTCHSPLEDWAADLGELGPDLSVVERPFLTQLTLRVADAAASTAAGEALGVPLPSAPCTFSRGTGPRGELEVLWMGPDEYLVVGGVEVADELERDLRDALAGLSGAVVDVSAQRTTLALSGSRWRDVLAHGCSIDLHPSAAPDATCVQTLLARTGIVLLVRDAARNEFALLVRASFGRYLASWLIDASTEYRQART